MTLPSYRSLLSRLSPQSTVLLLRSRVCVIHWARGRSRYVTLSRPLFVYALTYWHVGYVASREYCRRRSGRHGLEQRGRGGECVGFRTGFHSCRSVLLMRTISGHKLIRIVDLSDIQEAAPSAHQISQAGLRLKRTHSDSEDSALREVQRPCNTKKAKTAVHARFESREPGCDITCKPMQVCGSPSPSTQC